MGRVGFLVNAFFDLLASRAWLVVSDLSSVESLIDFLEGSKRPEEDVFGGSDVGDRLVKGAAFAISYTYVFDDEDVGRVFKLAERGINVLGYIVSTLRFLSLQNIPRIGEIRGKLEEALEECRESLRGIALEAEGVEPDLASILKDLASLSVEDLFAGHQHLVVSRARIIKRLIEKRRFKEKKA